MLMLVVWGVAVVMRKIGLPTIMGELVMGVVIGPAVFGWVTPLMLKGCAMLLQRQSGH